MKVPFLTRALIVLEFLVVIFQKDIWDKLEQYDYLEKETNKELEENQKKQKEIEEFSQIVKEQGLDINNKDDLTHLAFACYCGYVDVKETSFFILFNLNYILYSYFFKISKGLSP